MEKKVIKKQKNKGDKKTKKNESFTIGSSVGYGNFKRELQFYSRHISYEPSHWGYAKDALINMNLGQRWSELITWMVSADPFVQALIERRKNPIKSIEFVLQDENGDVDEDWTRIVCKDKIFKKILEEIVMSVFQGYAACQFDFEKGIFQSFPIELIDYKTKSLKNKAYETNGVDFFEDYNDLAYFESSYRHQTQFGLFQPLSLEYISMVKNKRNWDAFGTSTAVPTRMVGFNKGDVEFQDVNMGNGQIEQIAVNTTMEKAREIVENINPNQSVLVPFYYDKNTGKQVYEIEIKNSEQSAHTGTAYKCYEAAIKCCQDRMSTLVLGSILTISDGSSKSLGEVHRSVAKEVIESDIKMVIENLDNIIKPKLNIPEHLYFGTNQTQNLPIDEAEKISAIARDNNKILNKSFFNKIGVPKEYIEDVQDKEEVVKEKKEIEEEKIVKKTVPKKETKNALSKTVGLFFKGKEDLSFEEFEEKIIEKKIIEVDKKIIIKPSVEKRNSRYYNLKAVEEIMLFQNKKDLKKIIGQKKTEKMLSILNSGFIIPYKEKIHSEGLDCFEECLNEPTETWSIETKKDGSNESMEEIVYLKYYVDFVYSVKILKNNNKNFILESKTLRSCLEVEKLRNGILCREV